MPVRMFVDTATSERVSLENAPAHFDGAGVMPAEAVYALIQDESSEHRTGPNLSPSMLNGDKACRREMVIKRFLPYDQDPLVMWEALEGTVWHDAFRRMGDGTDNWHRELALPGPEDEGHPQVRRVGDYYQLEVFPGVWLHGTADMVRKDWLVLNDTKTVRYPWTPKPDATPRDFIVDQISDWSIQVNLYAVMIEILKGVRPKEQWVWRIYRGSKSRVHTFRKVPIPFLSKDALWERIREHTTTLRDYLMLASQAEDEAQLRQVISNVPMDGEIKRIYRGDKCLKYCSVREECFKMAGRMDF